MSRYYLQKIKKPKKQYEILANAITEVKERKEREENLRRYRTIIEEANDDVLIVDLEGNIKFANAAGQKFLGFKDEEILGKNIFKFAHPNEKEGLLEKFEEAVNSDIEGLEEKIEARWRENDRAKLLERCLGFILYLIVRGWWQNESCCAKKLD